MAESERGPAAPPFIDEHAIVVARPRPQVWESLERSVTHDLCRTDRNLVDLVLGTSSPGGFRVRETTPRERIVLEGSHRFSRYRLELLLRDEGAGTRVSARSCAEFGGIHGRVYRVLVISTRFHAVATRALLRRLVHDSRSTRSSDVERAPAS